MIPLLKAQCLSITLLVLLEISFACAVSCLPYGFGMLARVMLEDPTRDGTMKLNQICEVGARAWARLRRR